MSVALPSRREPGAVTPGPVTAGQDPTPAPPTIFGPIGVDPAGLTGLAPHRLEVATAVDRSGATVVVRGELLQETATVFADTVAELAADHTVQRVVVDLSSTSFMDSTGLGALVSLRNQVLVRGGRFALVRPRDRVFRLFELTRLDSVFEFVDGG